MRILTAFYDLKVSPVTFEIFEFLYQAEIARLDRGCDALDVIIVANNSKTGFREQEAYSISVEEKRWRLKNLLLPASNLLRNARRTIFCPTRQDADRYLKSASTIFPKGFTLENPIARHEPSEVLVAMYQGKKLGTFRAPPAAQTAVNEWVEAHSKGRKPVVITQMEAVTQTCQNSNIEPWEKFIQWLDEDQYFAILIPNATALFEQESAFSNNIMQFELGALDLQLRLAIYEAAYLNLVLSFGPGILCFLDNSTRAIRFEMSTSSNETKNYAASGFQLGMQWPNSTPYQKSVWEEDTFDTIVREFEEMVGVIEGFVPPIPRTLPDVYQTVSLFLKGGNISSAKNLLIPLLTHSPRDVQALFLLANAQYIQGDYAQTAETYQKLNTISVNNAEVYAGWGKSLLRDFQFQKAILKLRRAIEIGTSDNSVTIDLADAYSGISRYDDALIILRRLFNTLSQDEEKKYGWEVGKRLIAALLVMGAVQEAQSINNQLRNWFGNHSELAAEIAAFEASIKTQIEQR